MQLKIEINMGTILLEDKETIESVYTKNNANYLQE